MKQPDRCELVSGAMDNILAFQKEQAPATAAGLEPQKIFGKNENCIKKLADTLSFVDRRLPAKNFESIVTVAIKGIMAKLDRRSRYLEPGFLEKLSAKRDGAAGIGIAFKKKEGSLRVLSTIEGAPAAKSGLLAADKIVSIDNEPTQDMNSEEVLERLRGKKGSRVTLSVEREGMPRLKNISIVRDILPKTSVWSKKLEPGYAYIQLRNLNSGSFGDFKKALDGFTAQETLKGLLIDLRNNQGGLFDNPVRIADLFLAKGVIVSTKARVKNQNMIFKAHDNEEHPDDFAVIVLVNENTASGAEILAAALQGHKRALILGTHTHGMGAIQTIVPLSNGGGLKITSAMILKPNGEPLDKNGIVPDVEVGKATKDEEVFKLALAIMKKARTRRYDDLLAAATALTKKKREQASADVR
ncbi:carboxyl-terminal processing protease [Varunaivibrio sulfuroxidans]|uniref:Carboxyl-terminal processing protease n=1 Tax=Varunaivibrio sulfuroxidans TaxID=1773489 RepID=A0A4R3JBF0_9PROT|nr:carboxyl-terminal processing protease [Varunaivibrio sulfuroxidans]